MLPLIFHRRENLKILCLGAHCDDIEIGCGGTIMRLADEYSDIEIRWVVFTSNPERQLEARRSGAHFLERVAKSKVDILDHKDGFLPYEGVSVKNYFEGLKSFDPDVIFTHFRHDLHQDHRLICDLTWNTFRNHLILEYEISKYDGDLGNPNFFIPLDREIVHRKVSALNHYFTSQSGKHWFDEETFYSLMRIRGLECVSRSRYAEGFYLRKAVL
jgi:LmbE family N-acetylglucosaminyl deacetylase